MVQLFESKMRSMWVADDRCAVSGHCGVRAGSGQRLLSAASAFAVSAMVWAAPVAAQEADAAPAEAASERGVGEIIVTANRRAERLQDVPASISAFGAEDIKSNRVVDVYSLATSAPSFNITQDSAVSQQLNIRGVVSVKLGDPSTEPSVGMFIDDVYVPRMGSASTDFFDLERIEIIRGPQGVLLGKSVIGGAISVITAKPKFETSGQTTVSFGNYNSFMANGYLTGKLSDNISGRFAFQVRDHSGYNRNVLLNTPLDDLSSYQARAQLMYEGDDGKLRMLLSADFSHDKGGGTIRAAIDDPAIAGIGPIAAYRAANGIGPREDFSPQREYVRRWSLGTHLRVDWDVLDNATLTSITAYRTSKSSWGYNQIGTGSPPAIVDSFVYVDEDPRSFSQELRLVSNNPTSPFDWLVGAYYENDRVDRPNGHIASTNSTIAVFSGEYLYNASSVTNTTGLFAQLGYKIADGLKLTAGIRYTHDSKRGRKDAQCLADGGDGSCVTPFRGPAGLRWTADYGKSWDAVTPQAVLEYRPSNAIMVYASFAKGFKGGGWDSIPPTPVAAVIPFDPEHVTNYEIGAKTDLFDRRLRFNIAAFQMDYKDLQAQRTDLTCLCLITSNAGSARIRGVEVDATLALGDLTLTASSSILDPKYIDYDDRAGHIYNGNTMQRTPKFKYSVGAEYAFGLGSSSRAVTARINYTHQDKLYWAPDNVSYQPGYGLLDASIKIAPEEARWSVTLWGKNLTNKLYSQVGLPFFGDLVNVWGAPRTYGVDLSYAF